nr:extracellular solute-binding protein [Microbacterium barkeri]
MSFNKRMVVTAAFAVGAITLAGCSAGSNDNSEEGSGPVTLEVTGWKGNEAEPAGLPELIDKFEEEHPDITIEYSFVGRLDMTTVVAPRLQGGSPPDVVMTDPALVEQWGSAGLLQDLGTDSEWYDRIQESLKPLLTSDDAAYIMPLELIGMGNFYNTALGADAGVEAAPLTLDELMDACGALDESGTNPLIFTGTYSAPLFVIANGLEALSGSDVSTADLGSGKATFADSDAFNDALDSVRDLIDAKCFDPSAQAGLDPWTTALAEFQGGNFAMMPQGAWNIGAFSDVEGLEYEFGPIPSESGTGVALDLFGNGWSIPADTDAAAAAKTFVDWFAMPENLQVMLDAEAAYSPFDDNASGTPELAAPYSEAREAGGSIAYPFATLEWPKPLEDEIWNSLASFLSDPSMSNDEVLSRWDAVVADSD